MSSLGLRRRSSVLPSLTSTKHREGTTRTSSFSPGLPPVRWPRFLKQAILLLGITGAFLYLVPLSGTKHLTHRFRSSSSLNSLVGPELCPSCNTSDPAGFLTSTTFTQTALPTRSEVRLSTKSNAPLTRYLLHHIVLEPVMHKLWLSWETCGKLMANYFKAPDSLLAYNLEKLRLDTPTLYMYTRSGPGGKLADTNKRIKYFSRHVEAVYGYDEVIAQKGHIDGVPANKRQLIWVVVEDNAQIDRQLADYLHNTSIPYIYFAHGPTNWLGVAQWNAVDRAVDILRSTFYADGPVINIDDDSRILPELLRRVWRVKRAITWPVGNLGPQWEGLMCKNGTQDYWRLGGLPERTFPLDMNGFAINSSLIGPQGPIAPPSYVDFDLTGAETVFLQRIYKEREEIECLCDDTIEEQCFVSWHNWEEDPTRNVGPLTW